MLSPADLQLIVLSTAACAGATALVAVTVLLLWRRASIVSRFAVVVVAAVVAIVTSTVVIAAEMYFSSHDLTVLLWVTGVSAVMSLVAAWIAGFAVRRSIRRLQDSARRVGAGEVIEARAGGGSELAGVSAQLADASARLAAARAELEELDAARRTFFAWISHDLRTPLAGVRALAEALDDGVAVDVPDYIRRIRQQADGMSHLVDDLFELSRLQSGVLRPRTEPVELGDLVSDAVADVSAQAAARGIGVGHGELCAARVEADPHLMNRVVVNLLINAIRFAPDGSEVTVSARRTCAGVELVVSDQGPGVPPEHLGRMFEVGWRGDPARTPGRSATAGAGLGLAIVRAIAEAHGGRVRAAHTPRGFDVVFALPAAAG